MIAIIILLIYDDFLYTLNCDIQIIIDKNLIFYFYLNIQLKLSTYLKYNKTRYNTDK